MDYESGISALERLRSWARDNDTGRKRNEATTRLHLIDLLLFDCLAWNREECVAEERFEGTFTDYALGRPARSLVIEAKKEGTYFELPTGLLKTRLKLRTVLELSQDVDQAVRQALSYCQERGVAIGAVCNGEQLIAFIGSRQDGIPPLEGDAIVFSSLDQMRQEFRVLWDSLSAPGIDAQNIIRMLASVSAPPPPEKLSKGIRRYPGFKDRNSLQTELQILGDLFIEDIAKSPEVELDFLRSSYCQSGALSQYAVISRQLLETRYSVLYQKDAALSGLEPIQRKSGPSNKLQPDIVAASMSRRPIILLGDVGVGKSTFIRHFIRVEAKDILDRALVLYIDFGKEPALSSNLSAFIVERCTSQLRDDYGIDIEEYSFVRGVYNLDIQRFARGVFGPLRTEDPEEYGRRERELLARKIADEGDHLRRSLEHIARGQRRQVVTFLDNVDQRPSPFQEEVFLIAESLAETWPGTFFVSLRPDTFFESRRSGVLKAYQPRVFTIAPPRVDLVICKRLEFALTQLTTTGRLASFPDGLRLACGTLTAYLRIVLSSFESNYELMEFIDNMSGGNIRQALGFLKAFIGSGHVNTQKILDVDNESGSYRIPLHEFSRAVCYGDHEYFEPAASPFLNVFDISGANGSEHFLLPLLLCQLERIGTPETNQGYVSSETIHAFGQSIGFQPQQIRWALDRAVKKGLADSQSLTTPSYRITTVGAYSTKLLLSQFVYLDAVIVDTPITDPSFRLKILDVDRIEDRLERAEFFINYLDAQWASFSAAGTAFVWPAHSRLARTQIAKIRIRLDQRYASKHGGFH